MAQEIKFSVLVSLFNYLIKTKKPDKRTKFRKFLYHYGNPSNYFSTIRLILPSIDRERGNYGCKEHVLALCLVDALGISRDSEDAKRLINWRKGGAKIGKSAGNFSQVVAEVLMRRQSSISGGLTVRELNDLLDRLANSDGNKAKTEILGELIRKTNSQEMKWIVMIILKDLKVGMSEKTVFDEFHPDAEELFNVTCDLRLVCERLSDRKVRHKRQDIQPGKAVKPQSADRKLDWKTLLPKKFHSKEFLAECKFDGNRIQIHKNGEKVNYFSRNFIDHVDYAPSLSDVIVENVVVDKCILDGEILVWDNSNCRFAEFGKTTELIKNVKEGILTDKQLCYVAFDVLYAGDTSVIHRTLKERKEILKEVVRPVKGRLEVLLPNDPNARPSAVEPCWSILTNNVDEVERFLKETVANGDEGIVIKDYGSKWEPGDRNGKWIKLKPDYCNAGSDMDVLIIGGYYGTGRQGGEVAQFLVGLAEKPAPGSYPRRFVSFCRVGTGLTDEELDELVTKLKPYFRKYEYPKKSPPSFYQVTNHSRERPDVWVESPEKSVILSISSDIRTISSDVYATPHCLRFPRIDRVRYDKPWYDCLDVQSFSELVRASNGTTQGGDADKPRRARAAKKGGSRKLTLTVPSHFIQTDVSSVKGESLIFSSKVFHFVNVPSDHSLDSMHKLVVENGGTFSMNLNTTVTHCVGAVSRGIKYEAAKRRGCDIINYTWVLDCCSKKQLLPLRPNHFIFLSDSSKKKLQEEIDDFSDSYFWDLNVAELKQIFCNVHGSDDVKIIDYYKKKYCPHEKWCYFHGCCIYFHLVAKSHSNDLEFDFLNIVMNRMKVEVSLGGGKVTDNPSQATHIVVMSAPGHELKFETLMLNFPGDQNHILRKKKLHVVGFQWLEDCLKEQQKVPEVAYNLKPATLEESVSEEEMVENDNNYEKPSASSAPQEKPRKFLINSVSLAREPKRKRGRAVGSNTRKGKTVVSKPPRTKRARVGSKPAKLQEISSDDEVSEPETDTQMKASPEREMHDLVLQDVAFDDRSCEQETITSGKPSLKTEHIGLGSRCDISEKRKEEHKTDPLTEASPDLKMYNHVLQDIATDDKPSKLENNNTLRNSSLENNKEKWEEHRPALNEMRTHSGFVTCSKRVKGREYSTSDKSEENFDPIKGMLLDLIPSLGRKSEATNAVSKEQSFPIGQTQEGSSVVPPVEPVKKKKVSYKELAKQLLKN